MLNAGGIDPKVLPQARARVAAAKAIGAQRQVRTPFGYKGSNALGHRPHIVAGRQYGPWALAQLSGDKRQLWRF